MVGIAFTNVVSILVWSGEAFLMVKITLNCDSGEFVSSKAQ